MQGTEMQSELTPPVPPNHPRAWLVTAVILAAAVALCLLLWLGLSKQSAKEPAKEPDSEAESNSVESTAGIKVVTVSNQSPDSKFTVAGTVEPNQQQLQQITPLLGGRVEKVYVALGDDVRRGTLLLRIDSPQVAEQHGKLHEAETRLDLARANLNRVHQGANRVAVLKAKASLDEAVSTLKRTQLLVSEGLTARKDLVSAQSEFERATAEYNFQKDISLNKELAEAKAAVTTAETEAEHIRDGLKALDAPLRETEGKDHHDISKIELRSPISGRVIERLVNPGAGFEQGKTLLTIANNALLWVIANVPESQMDSLHVGSPATVKLSEAIVAGTVSYIDPRLNEDTRTSRVRIEISNPKQNIQIGSFAQVEFSVPARKQDTVFVPEASVQRVNGKQVVFVKEKSSEKFLVRDVTTGTVSSGMVPILSGLQPGEQIAADGSFILKSRLLKEQFGDED